MNTVLVGCREKTKEYSNSIYLLQFQSYLTLDDSMVMSYHTIRERLFMNLLGNDFSGVGCQVFP